MKLATKLAGIAGGAGYALFAALPAWAQDAAAAPAAAAPATTLIKAPTAEQMATMVN
ncbi:MAG: ammonia channel protein, partial [Sphingomonadales bacterium]